MSNKIVCVGLVMMDILVSNVSSDMFHYDTLKVNSVGMLSGGDANNQAIGLSKLGKEVVFVGCVGGDAFGETIVQQLRSNGIDTSHVIVEKNMGTSVSVVIIDPHGERVFLHSPTGNNNITIDMIDLTVLDDASIVCLGSLWSLPGLDGEGAAKLFEYAHSKGVITVADATPDIKYVGLVPIKQALMHTDYFLPSYREARIITGYSEPKSAAAALLEMGPKVVVVKNSSKGCVLASKDGVIEVPAFEVIPVDTTGAGDNFVAGFVAKLSENANLYDCVRFGNAVGALSTLTVGANNAQYTYEKIESIVKSNKCEK